MVLFKDKQKSNDTKFLGTYVKSIFEYARTGHV